MESEPRKISGKIVFYCDMPAYEDIKDMRKLENAVEYIQKHAKHEEADVSVWLHEEYEGNTKEYFSALYENAADVLTALPYTDIYPNEYAAFVSMSVPYSQLSEQVLAEVAENELISMLIVSHPQKVEPT